MHRSKRLSLAVNDETIANWRFKIDGVELVKALERNKIHFRTFLSCISAVPNYLAVPETLTAEAIAWRAMFPDDTSVVAIDRFYSDTERQSYLRMAERNRPAQEYINRAWQLLECDKVNLELMLISWGKRPRGRNIAVRVCMVPSTAFAERYIATDVDFCGEMGERAKEFIQFGQDSHGRLLFDF